MKLTIIGCSGSMSGPSGPGSCYLVEAPGIDEETGEERQYSILLDIGPGAMGHLLSWRNPPDIDAIFLSHMHADHMADIIGMYVYLRWYPGLSCPPLPIYSPAGGLERTRGIGGDGPEETYSGVLEFFDHHPRAIHKVGPFTIECFPTVHPVESYAMRITGPGEDGQDKVICYSGDTDTCRGVIDAACGADIFLCEAAFEEGRDSVRGIHLTGQRAGEVAASAQVGHLLLTHLQPWTDPAVVKAEAGATYSGPIDVVSADQEFLL